ncbi:MAG TPA: ABC transporter ATP-binding protein [Acidimicrobiales bacterium]|nr:ABC transporter ATP-binding protein [Acidimicrobiales bacterium]
MRRPRSAGPLRPAELAEAALLADLCVGLLFLGWMLPIGQVLMVLSAVPFAALGARHRARAVMAATVAASSICFLIGGVGLWSFTIVLGLTGMAIGAGYRRRWTRRRLALVTLPIWAGVAVTTVAQLLLFSNLRKLTLKQIKVSWHGLRNILAHASFLDPLLRFGDRVVNWMVAHCWVVIPIGELIVIELVTLAANAIARPGIRRLGKAFGDRRRPLVEAGAPVGVPAPAVAAAPAVASNGAAPNGAAPNGATPDGATPAGVGPVPVTLHEVSFRYPGADQYAVRGVDLELRPGTFLAVVGHNGSGKSTLARILAGLLEPEGELHRPGLPGLGQPGGTAMIFQRPESQVLGVRACDDVVWGLPPGESPDVEALLESVGLGGMAEEETSTMSGGQLQRLAVAAALARRPALLLSDESTSMIDPAGRREVMGVLADLAAQGVAVVHVTHRRSEAEAAGEVLRMAAGEVAEHR